ncbi:hypothetical protein [Streptomyces roseolilacinus]|uniref:hypothetical protein n=1 Tax=Streptomyces roseolilacinus TaxID=66904 RepID=UPI00381E8E9C
MTSPYGSPPTFASWNAGTRPKTSRRTPTPVALVLIHPDTKTTLTGTLQCARARIHGAWTASYRLLTHALAGRDLPADIDLTT